MQCGMVKTGFVGRMVRGFVAVVVAGAMLAPVARAEDTSTPKKAGVAFAKAVMAGDQAAVKALSTGTDAEFALIKSISDLASSMKKLEDATVKKFGPTGKLPKEMALDMVADFETADEKIEGDTATLVIKSKPDDKFPPTFKKDGDNWKVDLSNLDKDPQTAQMAPMIPLMLKALDTVAKNVEAGKYKSVEEAFADLGAQLSGGAPADPAK